MQRVGLQLETQRILVMGTLALLAGLIIGYPLTILLCAAVAYAAVTLVKVSKLYQWLEQDCRGLPPNDSGLWGDLADYIYRLHLRNESARADYGDLADRIRKITGALDDGMLLLDPDQGLEWWNPAASSLLKFRDDDRAQHITNLVRDPRFVQYMRNRRFEVPIELPSPFDPARILQFSVGSFGRNELVLMVRDITRLRHLEQMRKEFVGNISHELRTPLTVLMGYLETLSDQADTLSPQWQKALEQMTQQTRRMNSLAEDLVMLSRLESTPVPPGKKLVEVCPLLTGIAESAQALCPETHVIRLDCEPGLCIPGEAKELHSAFSNLVYNAIRHNPEGCELVIQAKTGPRGLAVRFADDGIGIDSRHLPRLTERFYRVENSRSSASGGTGLGLAIVKHVLMRHHGQLEIRSSPGKGAIFTCLFDVPETGPDNSDKPSSLVQD